MKYLTLPALPTYITATVVYLPAHPSSFSLVSRLPTLGIYKSIRPLNNVDTCLQQTPVICSGEEDLHNHSGPNRCSGRNTRSSPVAIAEHQPGSGHRPRRFGIVDAKLMTCSMRALTSILINYLVCACFSKGRVRNDNSTTRK